MQNKSFPFLLTCVLMVLSCNNGQEKKSSTNDTLKTEVKGQLIPADAAIELKTNISPAEAKAITVILDNGKEIALNKFPQADELSKFPDGDVMGEINDHSRDSAIRSLIDIDHDNTLELVTQYIVLGTHQNYISDVFTRVSENKYKRILSYPSSISARTNSVSIYFFDDLVGFNTCFACGIDDELPYHDLRGINLELKNAAFQFAAKNDKMNQGLEQNLAALKKRGVAQMKDGQDDGTRKEYAFNIVAYYFNNDRDLAKAKEAFEKYYDQPDKDKIWKELEKYILDKTQSLKKTIKFNTN